MSPFANLEIAKNDGSGLTIDGEFASDTWRAKKLGDGNVLVGGPLVESEYLEAVGKCQPDVMVGLLYGLVQRHFTGFVEVLVDGNTKALYFQNGELVFCRSELMDDRLGEVIYREGKITIDQMTSAAVEVSRERKFGKVLIESEEYNSADLWDFLKLQIQSIFQSVFLTEEIHYYVMSDPKSPPVSIILETPTEKLIEQCASFSQMFRGFKGRVGRESQIEVREGALERAEPGTHTYDTLVLIGDHKNMADFLEQTKLSEINTYLNLFNLVVNRMVEVKGLEASTGLVPVLSGEQRELKGYVDAYHVVLKSSVSAFEKASVPFPYADLESFTHSLNPCSREL